MAAHLAAKGAEGLTGKDAWLWNDDIRPLKLSDRTWTFTTYLTFWFSATASVSNWYLASSGQALGLSMWESTAYMLGGNIMIAFVIPIPKMRKLVYAKLIVFAIWAIAMLAWTLTLAGAVGVVTRQPGTVSGSTRTWLIIRIFFLGTGNYATFASNAADFQRYARRPNDVLLGNLLGFPLSNFIVAVIGNLVASSSQAIYGEIEWNPVLFLNKIQTTNYTAANRAGCFFMAAAFTCCAIFSSIFEKSLPAGNDIAALFPKVFSVRKGFFVCQVLFVAINPWYLLAGASVFVNFLASYQIFLSAITGVLPFQYYIVSRGYLKIEGLFTGDKGGAYYYYHGWNWRAYAPYIIGIVCRRHL